MSNQNPDRVKLAIMQIYLWRAYGLIDREQSLTAFDNLVDDCQRLSQFRHGPRPYFYRARVRKELDDDEGFRKDMDAYKFLVNYNHRMAHQPSERNMRLNGNRPYFGKHYGHHRRKRSLLRRLLA